MNDEVKPKFKKGESVCYYPMRTPRERDSYVILDCKIKKVIKQGKFYVYKVDGAYGEIDEQDLFPEDM